MLSNNSKLALLALCGITVTGAAKADDVKLKLLPTGAMPKIGFYRPLRFTISPVKPASVKVEPPGLISAQYGEIKFGPKESRKGYGVILDEPEGKPAQLFVDSNGDGDFTNDPPVKWTGRPYKGQDGAQHSQYMGSFELPLKFDGKMTLVSFGAYQFDKTDPQRATFKDTVLFYRDYGVTGEVKLGAKTYNIMLSDEMATGDFRGELKAPASDTAGASTGVSFMIDVNGNGRFDNKGENYDVGVPFNISGQTYEISKIDPSGSKLTIKKSAKTVAEILPPMDLGIGKKALVFERKTMDGKTVSFPSSFKGKVVMLDFWATWCGPCMGEVPNLAKVYEKYHSKGFEILGITLDQANAVNKINQVTKANKMTWDQVYDGKYWKAEIAQLYSVDSIPHAVLVDGDTGMVLADTGSLRGEQLEKTIIKALDAKLKAL